MSMQILPATAKVTKTRPSNHVLRRIQDEGAQDPALERMRDCLDVAFPPAGQKAAPAARVWSGRRLPAEPALTELSFGSSEHIRSWGKWRELRNVQKHRCGWWVRAGPA